MYRISENKAAEPVYGDFANAWGGEDQIVIGKEFSICQPASYISAHIEANGVNGVSANYDDLALNLETNPALAEAVG